MKKTNLAVLFMAAALIWTQSGQALFNNPQLSGDAEEPKVQRPIAGETGATSSAGTFQGDLHSSTEKQIQEWDARISDLRLQLGSAKGTQRERLREAIDELERSKRDIRKELKDLSARMEALRVDAQKHIQASFRNMDDQMKEIRNAE
jgi:chromosome segregation ATPase